MVAARLANMPRGGDPATRATNPSLDGLVSQTQAAADLSVGVASVERAKAVLDSGDEWQGLPSRDMADDDPARAFGAEMAAEADRNRRVIDGTAESVKAVLSTADFVLGVWPAPGETCGLGLELIKGRRAMRRGPALPEAITTALWCFLISFSRFSRRPELVWIEKRRYRFPSRSGSQMPAADSEGRRLQIDFPSQMVRGGGDDGLTP
jgi:hypothetical protein